MAGATEETESTSFMYSSYVLAEDGERVLLSPPAGEATENNQKRAHLDAKGHP